MVTNCATFPKKKKKNPGSKGGKQRQILKIKKKIPCANWAGK